MAYVLIDWHEPNGVFLVRPTVGVGTYHQTAEDAVGAAVAIDIRVRVNEKMPAKRLVELIAAATFGKVALNNLQGERITETPVPDAKVSYITREQLGSILPDGWYIECQLNRFSACWGDTLTLPARTKLAQAITDMRDFLGRSAKQALDDLALSLESQVALAEMEQLPMWLSSDSPKGAADPSAELDNMASTS